MPSLVGRHFFAGVGRFSNGRLALRFPQRRARRLQVRQVQAQVEFVLMVVRFHPQAHVVEGLVMVLFLQVRGLIRK